MSNQLLQLKVVGVAGDGDAAIERDIIATGAMPLFHLHRVLQFTLAPAQWDESIDEKKFKFTHKASRTELKAPKGRQMFKAGPPDTDCLAIGTEWVYEVWVRLCEWAVQAYSVCWSQQLCCGRVARLIVGCSLNFTYTRLPAHAFRGKQP